MKFAGIAPIAPIVPIALVGLCLIVISIELALRYFYGFGNPLIYEADAEIGYLLAPNQNTRRFGNNISINQYAMRSRPLNPNRSANTLRIFLVGDSVANGGWWTDQTNTISEILQQMVQKNHKKASKTIEVLNASANSWSPRSELAYLKRFGLFESQILVLLINTDDLFAVAPSPLWVGNDPNYPDRQPWGAIAEVMTRYVMPQRPQLPELKQNQAEEGDRVGKALNAIGEIQAMATANNSQFLLVMTPLRREVEQAPRDYELDARARLLEFTQTHKIAYIDDLIPFKAVESTKTLYHDHIHLSAAGNAMISTQVTEWIVKYYR
jgi:GDSL-like Lipase/Acylhydrolase family